MYNQLVLEKYCPAPEMGIDIDPQGYIKVCCGTVTKLCHLDDNIDWSNFFNSKLWIDSKVEIQSGNCKTNIICKNCISNENKNIVSQRQALRYSAGMHHWDYSKPTNIDIDLGNVCNLWCVMCSSRNSTKWAKVDPTGILHSINNQDIYKPFRFKSRYIDNVLDKMFIEIQRCTFKGGEPFAFKDFEYMLEWLLSKNCQSVEIVTNATLWTEKYSKTFLKFPNVFFSVSVDGCYKISDWIRYDRISSYQTVKDNIAQMSMLQNAGGSLVHVTMPYNLYTLPEFLLDFDEEFSKSNWWINLKQICINPPQLNVNSIVPLESRLKVAQRLRKLKLNYKTRFLKELIDYIELPVHPDIELQRQFVDYTNLINKKKSFNIWNEVPELQYDLKHILK